MGISGLHAELIIREHKFRPLPKVVHLLGRQTVQLSQQQALAMLERDGIRPAAVPIEFDRTTSYAIASGQDFITDRTFYGLLRVETVRAIDHSDFEGADIILDPNEPISNDLAGIVEFLYGGSVLDNIFDPAIYIKNLARLLTPHGRLIDQNLGSFHLPPYVIASPAWYFDYYVLNGFDDCKIYFVQPTSVTHIYGLGMYTEDSLISDFGSAGIGASPLGIVVLAEKGGNSTWDRVPSQDQYRSAAEWDRFRNKLRRVIESPHSYEVFSSPTPEDLACVPLRWTRSFRYLGCVNGRNERFDGTLPQPARQGIKIVEASYGANLLGQPMLRSSILPICIGNVTEKLAELVNGQDSVEITVDSQQFGDPAPDLGKALDVYHIYLDDPAKTLREVHITAEAHGRKLEIPPFLNEPVNGAAGTSPDLSAKERPQWWRKLRWGRQAWRQ